MSANACFDWGADGVNVVAKQLESGSKSLSGSGSGLASTLDSGRSILDPDPDPDPDSDPDSDSGPLDFAGTKAALLMA
jgi:hypothetical protein